MDRKCLCAKDEDGRCESCIASISDVTGRVLHQTVEHFRAMRTIQQSWSSACSVCSVANMDYAIAKAVKTISSELATLSDPDCVQAYVGVVRQLVHTQIQGNGPKEWPLTEKALQEVV